MSAPFPPDPPPASPSAQTNDAPTHDDDGFPVGGFDYVISSTSLPLTILSSALAIAGKSVLCHDQNTWYGGDEGYCSSSLKNSVKGSEGGLRVEECECDDSLSCQVRWGPQSLCLRRFSVAMTLVTYPDNRSLIGTALRLRLHSGRGWWWRVGGSPTSSCPGGSCTRLR